MCSVLITCGIRVMHDYSFRNIIKDEKVCCEAPNQTRVSKIN